MISVDETARRVKICVAFVFRLIHQGALRFQQRWNDAAQRVLNLETEYTNYQRQTPARHHGRTKRQILRLPDDFPRLRNAPTTETRDRERPLRLLIKHNHCRQRARAQATAAANPMAGRRDGSRRTSVTGKPRRRSALFRNRHRQSSRSGART
jgi:hypothetical protein